MKHRAWFVLSIGHTVPGLHAALANRGFFPVEDLPTLRHIDSYLQGHPNMNTVPGVDMSTGSLGQGISCAAGMATTGLVPFASRFATPLFHDEENFRFEIGKGEVLRDGSDVALITNGLLVYEALKAAEILAEQRISARVINMATVKPLDEELVLKAAADCGKIVTCEEHSVIGGLGEAVCALLSEKMPTLVHRVGINDEFGHSGPAGALLKQFGLCAEHIADIAKKTC